MLQRQTRIMNFFGKNNPSLTTIKGNVDLSHYSRNVNLFRVKISNIVLLNLKFTKKKDLQEIIVTFYKAVY